MAGRRGRPAAVRLLLDEMLAPVIAQRLRDLGHDVEAISGEASSKGLSDADVMTLALRQRRAVVTNNLVDFRPLHHEALLSGGPGHFGMVFMPGAYRRTRSDVSRIVQALERKLAEFPNERDLANAETWL